MLVGSQLSGSYEGRDSNTYSGSSYIFSSSSQSPYANVRIQIAATNDGILDGTNGNGLVSRMSDSGVIP